MPCRCFLLDWLLSKENFLVLLLTIAHKTFDQDMVEIYQVVLDFCELFWAIIVFLEHLEVIFPKFGRNSLVMRNVLVDLHDHFLAFSGLYLHILAQKLILLGWCLIYREISIGLIKLSRLAAFVSLNVLGRCHSVRNLIGWTKKEFLVLQTVNLDHILLLAENLCGRYHAALSFLEIVELELRVTFCDHCLLFWFTAWFVTLFQVLEQKSARLTWLFVWPSPVWKQLHFFLRNNCGPRKVFGCHRPFFADTNPKILILRW